MIEESTTKRVLAIFFDNPTKQFHLRELSRTARLSLPTIILSTEKLTREKLIVKKKGKVVTQVHAQRENTDFIRKKRVYNLQKIYDSGIVEDLESTFNHPRAIILFGSFSRGEDTEDSDIDIAIITSKKRAFNTGKYEQIFKRSVNLHEVDLAKTSHEFKANLYNGIILEGSW